MQPSDQDHVVGIALDTKSSVWVGTHKLYSCVMHHHEAMMILKG
jgi:hypothetical protein